MVCIHDSYERCYQDCEDCRMYYPTCCKCGGNADLYKIDCDVMCFDCLLQSEKIYPHDDAELDMSDNELEEYLRDEYEMFKIDDREDE